jgi:hypothetical protein
MPAYNPPVDAFYTEIAVPSHVCPEKFIGRSGFHLKRITELSRCDYIWLDFKRCVVEVWSYEERYLAKALRMLSRRINSFPVVPTTPKVPLLKVDTRTEYPRTFVYELTGKPSQCILEYEKILKEFPKNPYFTEIQNIDMDGTLMKLTVTRSTTSD